MINVLAAEDCVEFRMLQLACGSRPVDEWFRDFLSPEGIDPESYVAALIHPASDWTVALAPTRASLLEQAPSATVLVVERQTVDKELLDAARELRSVVVYGSNVDFVDAEECRRRGVSVAQVLRRTTANVADHVLLLTLALSRRLLDGARVVPGNSAPGGFPTSTEHGGHPQTVFNWVGVSGIDALSEKRFGVVGSGETGTAVIRRAHAFGMRIGYCSRRRSPMLEGLYDAEHFGLHDLAEWADVASLHLPYSPELRELIDERFLSLLGPSGTLVNTSRGLLVKTEALVDALRSGGLGAAGLDVFDSEPIRDGHPLLDTPRTILTPHVAAGTRWTLITDVNRTIEAIHATAGIQ